MSTANYFKLGTLGSKTGVFCITNHENITFWQGTFFDEDESSDYDIVWEEIEEQRAKEYYWETIMNFNNSQNRSYLTFSNDCSKGIVIYENEDGFVLLEVIYCDSIPNETSFDIIEDVSNKIDNLQIPTGNIVMFDATLSGDEVVVNDGVITKSTNNKYFDDIASLKIQNNIKKIHYVKYEIPDVIHLNGYEFIYAS